MNDEIIKNLIQLYANANVRIEQLERENAVLRGALNEIKACALPTSVFHHIVDNALACKETKP